MKTNITKSNNTLPSRPTTGIDSRISKLGTTLRKTLGALGVLALGLLAGTTANAAGIPVVDVGTGTLPTDAQFAAADNVNLRISLNSGKKYTKFENTSATPSVQKGQVVTTRALMQYLDKNGKWQNLGYTSAQNIELWVNGHVIGRANTDRSGYVTFQFIPVTPNKISPKGMRVNYHVVFNGDTELRSCRVMGSFNVVN